MISNEVGMQLHDRATRGKVLTSAERLQLHDWYAEQNERESQLLHATTTPSKISQIQAQLDNALARLAISAQNVQKITANNKTLRSEIALLRKELFLKELEQAYIDQTNDPVAQAEIALWDVTVGDGLDAE